MLEKSELKELNDIMLKSGIDTRELREEYDRIEEYRRQEAEKTVRVDYKEGDISNDCAGGILSFECHKTLIKCLQTNSFFESDPCIGEEMTVDLTKAEWEYLPDTLNRIEELTNLTFSLSVAAKKHIRFLRNQSRKKSAYSMIDATSLSLPFTPYEFQLEDIQRIGAYKRMLIGHDMGCGKTFISTIIGTSIPERKLVIVPGSLRLNWEREIKRITPHADVKILYSKDSFKTGKDWTIVGYATAGKYLRELREERFNCVFIDEAHKCKAVNNKGEPSSKRAQAVMEIAEEAEYCYLLTGTPIPTSNRDLYNILRILKVDEIDFNDKWAFFNYGKEYCDGKHNGFGWDFSGNSNGETLHKILEPNMVRRLKKEALPNLIKQRSFVPLKVSNAEIRDIESRMKDSCEDNTFLGLAMTGRRLMSIQKLSDCKELCDTMLDAEESVVVVSEFKETINSIREFYKDDCCLVVGGMSDNAKQQAIDDFQSGKKHVCAVNTIAGGVGISLTKASNMIICDFAWTPANMIQVEDRICRAGQENPCNIYYLYADDCILDKYFVDMITDKNGNIDLVVDESENTMNLKDDKEKHSSFLDYLKDKLQFRVPCNIQPEKNTEIKKIAMLSKCNRLESFDEDVKKYTQSIKREKTLMEWNKLIELRRRELEDYLHHAE